MSALIDDLLNLSRATSTPLHRVTIDLSHMAEEILHGLSIEEPDRKVRCTVVPGARAIADEGLLHVVLQNLLGNAWKYTVKGKRRRNRIRPHRPARRPPSTLCATMAPASIPAMPTACSGPSSASTRKASFPAPASGSPRPCASSRATAAKSGRRARWIKGATFFFTLPYDGTEQ